ncbi:hypothetical protein EDC01DRAFT_756553 [Geopyxis carbonaria]|nr:hypothetical protein EDC01DRAFT_756553 [Geopyxis carbonaria]
MHYPSAAAVLLLASAFATAAASAITSTTTPPDTSITHPYTCTRCEDYFDDCGHTWGGCYVVPSCGGTKPVWEKPTCVPTTTTTTTVPTDDASCTLCADYFDECGHTWGGCYRVPECGGTVPVFTSPGCTPTPTPTPTP